MVRKSDTGKPSDSLDEERSELPNGDSDAETEFRFEDRRHWVRGDEGDSGPESPRAPTMIDEFRTRAEEAEQKLQEYIEAFKTFRSEQEQFRGRLARDVDRKVELRFGDLVTELLDAMDDLDLALEHVRDVPGAEALARGVDLARRRFLGALERNGVTPMEPSGATFDPTDAEAMRMDPVDSAEHDGKVTEVLRAGYRLGDRVIRPARVAVGKFDGA